MSKLHTTMSTLSYIDQMSLHIQDDRKVEQTLLFIHLHNSLPSHHISILKTKIQHKYTTQYSLQYFQTYKYVLTLSLKNQPTCIIFVGFADRAWAKRFCSNQQLSERFRMYVVAGCEEEREKAQKYNTNHLKVVLFPNDIEQVSTQICLLAQKSVRTDSNKLICPTYFQHYSNQKLLTIYMSSDLVAGFKHQGKKILKSKEHSSVQIRQFKNMEQFFWKLKEDMNVRKKCKMQVDQLIIEECENKKLSSEEQMKLWRVKELELRNLIFVERSNPDLDSFKQFIFEDYRRWEIISIDESEEMCERIPNQYADYPFPQETVPELNQIIESQELFILVHKQESSLLKDLSTMNQVNCNNRIVPFSNGKELGQILTNLQLRHNSYGILVTSSGTYKEYRSCIRSYIDSQYPILNLKILLTEPFRPTQAIFDNSSIILGQQNGPSSYEDWFTSNFLPNENKPLIQLIFQERCLYFYPAFGLEERKIVLLVNHQQPEMVNLAHEITKKNKRRISVEYWNGLEHVQYILSKLKEDQWGLIFIHEHSLKSAADVLTNQSQLIVVGNQYKKYSHRKILKQGSEQQIVEFFNLIPGDQSNSLSTAPSLYNDSQLPIQTLKRFDFDDNIMKTQQSATNLISVRLPLNIEVENSSLLETKLISKLKEGVVVKYYGTTGEIRDMGNRWEEKTQYLVITDDYLQWTEEFAKRQHKQRFEIILYTYQNVDNFERLVTKHSYSRFKLVTNRWSEIESYITRSNQLCLEGEQKLEIVLGEIDRKMENLFENSDLLSRTYFKYYDQSKDSSIKDLIRQISPKNLIFVILNEKNTESMSEQRVIEDIVKLNPSARTILVSPSRKSNKPRTIVSLKSIEEVANWISRIKIRGSMYNPTGTVKVDRLR